MELTQDVYHKSWMDRLPNTMKLFIRIIPIRITQIYFALPNDGFTKLTVYNSIGIEVRTLISEMKAAGNHSISFNASELPSGIYFY